MNRKVDSLNKDTKVAIIVLYHSHTFIKSYFYIEVKECHIIEVDAMSS